MSNVHLIFVTASKNIRWSYYSPKQYFT